MPSTTATAAWSVGVCSPARSVRLPGVCACPEGSPARSVRLPGVFACPEAASLEALRAWPGLRTVLAVETIRGVNGSGTVEAEIRYVLSSCGDDPKVLIQAIRRHWTLENGLHWVLDVTFREDDSRVRDRTAARNLALLRKVAINLISHGRTAQISMRARRKQAAWNDEYMLSLLAG